MSQDAAKDDVHAFMVTDRGRSEFYQSPAPAATLLERRAKVYGWLEETERRLGEQMISIKKTEKEIALLKAEMANIDDALNVLAAAGPPKVKSLRR